MLQHEQEQPFETPLEIPAAQRRVTSEELAQAINALDASKDEAARHLAGTVPIGEVVQELKLEATPEEIWAQVQRQRAQKVAEDTAAQAAAAQREQAAQTHAAAQLASVQAGRQVYERPRRSGRWWAILAVGFVVYGGIHASLVHMNTGGIVGDNQTLTSATHGNDMEVTGDNDTLTLQGNCPTLTITGDGNHIQVKGSVGRVIATGDNNSVIYTQGDAPALDGTGDGNHVGPQHP